MDIPDKKILREKEKFPAVGTAQRVPVRTSVIFVLAARHDNALKFTALDCGDNAVVLGNFHEKKKEKKNWDVPLELGWSLSGFIEKPRTEPGRRL